MYVKLRRLILLCVLAVLSAFSGCACGFLASTHLRNIPSAQGRMQYLRQPGDAPLEVRSGVILELKSLQEGYSKRDVNGVDAFMARLFAKDEDVMILGTDSGEWVHGYKSATEFIKGDWQYWGDLRLAVDNSTVWSSGDVAWFATIGVVQWKNADRPLRLTGVLVRRGNLWLFRELHFQWDERQLSFRDLFRPKSGSQFVNWIYQRVAGGNTMPRAF